MMKKIIGLSELNNIIIQQIIQFLWKICISIFRQMNYQIILIIAIICTLI